MSALRERCETLRLPRQDDAQARKRRRAAHKLQYPISPITTWAPVRSTRVILAIRLLGVLERVHAYCNDTVEGCPRIGSPE